MDCLEFRKALEQVMEGEDLPEARAHAGHCPACAGLIQDLRVITRESCMLGEYEPSQFVWDGIRHQLAAEGLLAPTGWLERLRGWFERLLPFAPTPAFSAVYALLLLVGLGLVFSEVQVSTAPDATEALSNVSSRVEKAALGNGYEAELAQLEHSAMQEIALSNPELRAAYVQNLATLDEAIRTCKHTLKQDPNDRTTREYLYAAYQQKATVLQSLLDPDLM